jgi:hypothetical protein
MSAGRCGTMTLARLLDTAENARVWHHPQPDLILEALKAYRGDIDKRTTFRRARSPIMNQTWAEGLIHGETDLLMTPFVDEIAEEIADSKFIVLVRDPRDFVRSGMRRNYYRGHPWDAGRLRPREGTAEYRKWNAMTQFEKVCWLWARTYEKILEYCDQLGKNRVLCCRFEELTADINCIQELFRFLGLRGYDPFKLKGILSKKLNQQVSGAYPEPNVWPRVSTDTLWRICGPAATCFGYSETYSKPIWNSDRQYDAPMVNEAWQCGEKPVEDPLQHHRQ